MAGAILLSARAALYSGAGWILLGAIDESTLSILQEQPELMISKAAPGLVEKLCPDVIAIGPGLGQSSLSKDLLREVLCAKQTAVIDADALNLIASHKELMTLLQARSQFSTVLTPHPGEAGRLLGESAEYVQAHRQESLSRLLNLTGSIIVLKGEGTLIGVSPDQGFICQRGNPGMGVGGMGDVLTGLLAALIAQGLRHHLSVEEAVCLGVELHSGAADILRDKGVGPIGLTPSELVLEIRNLINIK
jgi:hydroxyethylthiazole kinase-like uncharacterized protein yjeF